MGDDMNIIEFVRETVSHIGYDDDSMEVYVAIQINRDAGTWRARKVESITSAGGNRFGIIGKDIVVIYLQARFKAMRDEAAKDDEVCWRVWDNKRMRWYTDKLEIEDEAEESAEALNAFVGW